MTTPSAAQREREHAEIRSRAEAFLGVAYDDLDESERNSDFWDGYRDGVYDFAFAEWNQQTRRGYPPMEESSRHEEVQRVARLLKSAKKLLAVNPRSIREDRALARVMDARDAFAKLVAALTPDEAGKTTQPTDAADASGVPEANIVTVSAICAFCQATAPSAEPAGWARWSRVPSDDFPLPYFFSTCPEHSTHEGLWANAPGSRTASVAPHTETCGYDAIPGVSSARVHELFRLHGWQFCPECAAPLHTPVTKAPPTYECYYDAIPGVNSARTHELFRLHGRRFCPECATPLRTPVPATPNQPKGTSSSSTSSTSTTPITDDPRHDRETPLTSPATPAPTSHELSDLQRDVREWHAREFDPLAPPNPLANGLMLCEEAGEVARCLVKRHQHVRGDQKHWDAELRKEIGDVVITALNLASDEGFDLGEVVRARWADVRQRRFATAPDQSNVSSQPTPDNTYSTNSHPRISQ